MNSTLFPVFIFILLLFLFLLLLLEINVMYWEKDSIVEELPFMYIMPTSNLLEVIDSIP